MLTEKTVSRSVRISPRREAQGFDLLRLRPIAALIHWVGFPYVFQGLMLLVFLLLIVNAWGRFAPAGINDKLYAKTNLTTLVIWGLWWPSMIWTAVLFGRAWCKRVVTVSVGQIRKVDWKGKTVETAIFKRPLDRRARVGLLGIEGDEHANKAQHGGSLKALFAYPSEHYYEFWRDALPEISISHGGFGENLTTEGWLEEHVYVADKYRVGTALVAITIPRKPCFKLNALHGRDDVLPEYLQSGRTGFYLTVLVAGEIGAGYAIELVERHPLGVTPGDIVRLYMGQSLDRELLDRALRIEIFNELQRKVLAERFERFILEHEDESKEL